MQVGNASTGGVVWARQAWWSDDGRSVVYQREGDAAIVDVRFEPSLALGEPRTLMQLPEERHGMDYDAPRRRFLVAKPVGTPRASLIVIQNWQRLLEKAE
jgi:hypothetical protein